MEKFKNNVIKYGVLLEEMANDGGGAFGSIARILEQKIYKHEQISKAIDIAKEASVSNATVTKFVKTLGYNNFNELAFVHNASLVRVEKEVKSSKNDIIKAAKMIDNARRILFVGVSNAEVINLDFSWKLQRMNKWVITPPSKYEQVGLSKLLTPEDLLIINSISLQHTWMSLIAKRTKAKIIVLTAVDEADVTFAHNLYFKIHSHERSDIFRIVTMQNRNEVLKIYDQITNELLKNDENFKYLELSSYRNTSK